MAALPPKDRVYIALDLPDVAEAEALIQRLGDDAGAYKIGYQLTFSGGGLALARRLADAGKRVFLDMKLHDIGNTVEKGVEQIARMGFTYLTVHAFPQTMAAAVKGRGASSLKVLGVTVLTSWNEEDLREAGYALGVEDLVKKRAQQAKALGMDGLILSPNELKAVRALVGPSLDLVTPGVRPKGGDLGDQKRVMTPGEAIKAGADALVVGRPITEAKDPKAALVAILHDVEQAGE
jgi:orotidine-5'-phosphate decarboxylase